MFRPDFWSAFRSATNVDMLPTMGRAVGELAVHGAGKRPLGNRVAATVVPRLAGVPESAKLSECRRVSANRARAEWCRIRVGPGKPLARFVDAAGLDALAPQGADRSI